MQFTLVIRELVPVAIRTFDDDLPLFEQSLEQETHLEFLVFGVRDADGDVLEVDEKGYSAFTHVPAVRRRSNVCLVAVVIEGGLSWHRPSLALAPVTDERKSI